MDDEQAEEEEVSLPFVGDEVSSSRERDLRACAASALKQGEEEEEEVAQQRKSSAPTQTP